jgi:hypothetical protein
VPGQLIFNFRGSQHTKINCSNTEGTSASSRRPYKARVTGSSPVPPTNKNGGLRTIVAPSFFGYLLSPTVSPTNL